MAEAVRQSASTRLLKLAEGGVILPSAPGPRFRVRGGGGGGVPRIAAGLTCAAGFAGAPQVTIPPPRSSEAVARVRGPGGRLAMARRARTRRCWRSPGTHRGVVSVVVAAGRGMARVVCLCVVKNTRVSRVSVLAASTAGSSPLKAASSTRRPEKGARARSPKLETGSQIADDSPARSREPPPTQVSVIERFRSYEPRRAVGHAPTRTHVAFSTPRFRPELHRGFRLCSLRAFRD